VPVTVEISPNGTMKTSPATPSLPDDGRARNAAGCVEARLADAPWAKLKVRYYTTRRRESGKIVGYWQPTKAMKDAGFALVSCGIDGPSAWRCAEEWNARWDDSPEAGKTTIALSYLAIVSAGGTWPDGTRAAIGNVLMWTSEDDPSDTLIPRLIRMGADLSRIYIIEQTRLPGQKPRPFNPATDLAALAEKAKSIGDVVLFVIDSVVSAVPPSRNSHNNAETRTGLQPVVDFARETHAAVLGISHLTKGTAGKDPLEWLTGSLAFGALPRLVMFAANNHAEGENEPERIMVRVKTNIGPQGGGFGYHIDIAKLYERPDIEATRIVWEHEIEGSARDLLADAEHFDDDDGKKRKIDKAKDFLTDALSRRERPQMEIESEAKALGISSRTLNRAASSDLVHRRKVGVGHWFWSLA
jgi:putative DNA primase/helicase